MEPTTHASGLTATLHRLGFRRRHNPGRIQVDPLPLSVTPNHMQGQGKTPGQVIPEFLIFKVVRSRGPITLPVTRLLRPENQAVCGLRTTFAPTVTIVENPPDQGWIARQSGNLRRLFVEVYFR
jgi:hypothetical protein